MRVRKIAVVLVVAFAALALNAQIVDPALQLQLTSTQPLRVIVTFDHPPNLADRALISGVASRFNMLSALPMALIETNAAGVKQLATTAGVQSLYLDRQLTYYLHESVPLIKAPQAWKDFGADGHGIGVAIIDSGIDATHPDLPFGSKVVQNVKIAGVDREDSPTGTSIVQVIENLPTSDSTSGHGTHCAGIVGGLGNASKTNSANDVGGYGYYTGVAPGAHLIGVGTGDTLFIFYALEGFDYVMSHRAQYNIKVVSNSWGSTMDPGE